MPAFCSHAKQLTKEPHAQGVWSVDVIQSRSNHQGPHRTEETRQCQTRSRLGPGYNPVTPCLLCQTFGMELWEGMTLFKGSLWRKIRLFSTVFSAHILTDMFLVSSWHVSVLPVFILHSITLTFKWISLKTSFAIHQGSDSETLSWRQDFSDLLAWAISPQSPYFTRDDHQPWRSIKIWKQERPGLFGGAISILLLPAAWGHIPHWQAPDEKTTDTKPYLYTMISLKHQGEGCCTQVKTMGVPGQHFLAWGDKSTQNPTAQAMPSLTKHQNVRCPTNCQSGLLHLCTKTNAGFF